MKARVIMKSLALAFWVIVVLGLAGEDRPVSGAGSTVLLAVGASAATMVGLHLFFRLLRRLPWLNWVPPVIGGLILTDAADLLSQWLSGAVLLAVVAWFVIGVVRSGRHYTGRSSRGDLGTPIPPLVGALARTTGRLVVPTVVYAALLAWPLDAAAPSWPGTAVGAGLGAGAFGWSIVIGLMSPRFPCAVALEPTSADGMLALGGRGNRVWLVRLVENRPVVVRMMGADSGLSPLLTLLTGDLDEEPPPYSDWLNRLTPGFVHAVCPIPGEDSRPLVASGGSEGGVHVWDVGTGHRVRALRESGTVVTALCTVPLDHRPGLAVADGTGVRVYDPSSWTVRWRSTEGRFCNALVGATTTSGHWIVVGDTRGTVIVHDAEDGTVTSRWQAHVGPVSVLKVIRLQGDDLVVSCGADGRMAVHELLTGSRVRSWVAAPHPLYALTAMTVDGRLLLTVGGDGPETTVWDPTTGSSAGVDPSPRLLLFGDRDIGFYRELCTLETATGSRVVGVGYSRKVFVLHPRRLLAQQP